MVKADLRKAESADSMKEIGECVEYARNAVGWTLDELAGKLPPPPGSEKRDPRQVARWIRGEERTPIDVIFKVPELRAPIVIALSRLADCDDYEREETTVISFKRRA